MQKEKIIYHLTRGTEMQNTFPAVIEYRVTLFFRLCGRVRQQLFLQWESITNESKFDSISFFQLSRRPGKKENIISG